MKYKIGEEYYEVVIEKKNNKNTYLRVKEDLTILITTNFFTTKHSVKKLLDDHKEDLVKMIAKKRKEKEKEENFYYLGKKYDIIEVYTMDNIEFNDNYVLVKSKDVLDKWLKKEMKRLFQERLDYWFDVFEEDIPYPKLKIRKMKTRWGVCNKRDNSVTLNSNLIKYNEACLEYVIVHELSHFVHFDHSKDFWNLVKKYCPRYKEITKELKG